MSLVGRIGRRLPGEAICGDSWRLSTLNADGTDVIGATLE